MKLRGVRSWGAVGLCWCVAVASGCVIKSNQGSNDGGAGGRSVATAGSSQTGALAGGAGGAVSPGVGGTATGAGTAGVANVNGGAAGTENHGGGAGADTLAGAAGAGDGGGAFVNWLAVLESAQLAVDEGKLDIDLTGDGVPDLRRSLSGATVLRDEVDADGDQVAELVWDYSQPTKTFRRDDNHDGNFEEAMDVVADATKPAVVTFHEAIDETSDGSPNIVRDWTVDPSIATVAIDVQEDTDGDGSLDWTITNTVDRVQGKFVNVTTSGAGACSPDKAAQIDAAVNESVQQAMDCLAQSHPSLGLKLAKFLTYSKITVRCDSTMSGCGLADLCDVSAPWFGKRDAPITLGDGAFDPERCGALSSTLFHEMMHYVLGGAHPYGAEIDPGDPVVGCERMCFGSKAGPSASESPASNLDCAACLGVRAGNAKCSKFPQKPCEPPPVQCPCRGILYADMISCSVGCPRGLACFTARCVERGPCRE